MSSPRNQKNANKFHELVYEAPLNAGSDIADALMKSFLTPFDSSVMQACVTVLSGVGLNDYFDAYFKVFPELIKIDPDTALSLLDYPGFEMNEKQILQIEARIKKLDPSGVLRKELDFHISNLGLKDDFPFSSLYYRN